MRRVLTAVVILAVTGVCLRFGVWQLDRLAERKEQNALVVARSASPVIPITGAHTRGLAAYRSVRATGTFDLDRQIVRVGMSMDGVPGVVVIAPLVLDDGSAILVERGWAPSPDARQVQLELLDELKEATVAGIVLPPSDVQLLPGTGWPLYVRSVNTDSLGGRYPYPLLPWVLRRTGSPTTMASHPFRAVRSRALSNGPHLNYAIQWFSFGLIALVGGSVLVFRTERGRPVHPTRD